MVQTPEELLAEKVAAEKVIADKLAAENLARGNGEGTPVTMLKPKEIDEVCEIVSISPALDGANGSYHIVTFFNSDGLKETIAVSAALRSTVADVTMAVGKSVNVTFSKNIAGKTQWLDKKSGEVSFHKSSTVNLLRVTSTTKAQERDLSREATFAFAEKKNVSKMITEAADADKIALSNLYASMLRG